jgi:1-acyl-sn-glycerol-3-phosphate acyltransferase
MKRISAWVLRLFGWKLDYKLPEGIERGVLVSAPHTSNWDFVVGRLAMWAYGVDVKILIKKEHFFFPMGYWMKAMGGIPVDRSKGSNVTGQIAEMFKKNEKLCVMFTPEGTRSYNPNWKKGFYYLAQKAEVPIFLGYCDYERKLGGIRYEPFIPTGDLDKDIEEIKEYYKQFKGKYPENGPR